MRIGINFTPPHDSPEHWGDILAERGFRAASFPVDYHAKDSLIDAYVKAAADRDIQIAEVGIWNSPHDPDPEKAREAYERCLEQFRLAEYVKARCCVNVSGAAGERWFGCYQGNFAPALYEKNVKMMQDLCDTVRPENTCYTLEPMQWMVPSTVDEYVQLLKDVDRPGFKVHMDICNLIYTPWSYTHMDQVINEAFDKLGPDIVSCHIKDLRMQPKTTIAVDEVPIGTGEMDLKLYMERIQMLDPETPVLIEHMDRLEDYERAGAVVYELLKNLK